MKKNIKIFTLILILFLFSPEMVQAQRTKSSTKGGELRKAEKGLKDNKYFLYFLDSSVTNFGSPEEKKLYKEASQRDILSQLLFLRFMFKESYKEVRKTQEQLVNLYSIALSRDIAMTKSLLNEIAPRVILKNNPKSVEYLRLGYRDQRLAAILMKMADNYKKTLYSMRLYEYVNAIKNAKHGKRYALLAMIESNLTHEQKMDAKYSDFVWIKNKITEFSPAEKKDHYSQIHLDNFYLTPESKSLYERIWDNPEIQQHEDYRRYLEESDY
ncbi:MAG: hypothetical protein JW864_08015 [Spirochaetes bacterium]|nr:hypothetical protein [Spirochaetota bacterium]